MLTATRINRDASPVSVARSIVVVPPSDITLLSTPVRTLSTTWKAIGASIPPLRIAISPVLTAITTPRAGRTPRTQLAAAGSTTLR